MASPEGFLYRRKNRKPKRLGNAPSNIHQHDVVDLQKELDNPDMHGGLSIRFAYLRGNGEPSPELTDLQKMQKIYKPVESSFADGTTQNAIREKIEESLRRNEQ